MTKIQAAVIREPSGAFIAEELTLDAPRADEVLVRIVATGLCHSDITASHCHFPPGAPVLLGHEGAGFIEEIGSEVTGLAPGDPVVLSYNICGTCIFCRTGRVAYCENFFLYNLAGTRPDGSHTLQSAQGPVKGSFFGQSSFATYVLANVRNVVKVRADAPLELLGPIGCGVQTGAGTVFNAMKPPPGSSFALFGCGAVGLSALMAAKVLGCDPIIAIDRVPERLALAKELGATETIDARTHDARAILTERGGVQYVVEATGVAAVLEQAVHSMSRGGMCGALGVPTPGDTITVDIVQALSGRSILGVNEGDSEIQTFIPYLIDLFMEGRFPIDKLSKFYTLDTINEAAADSLAGGTVKPILRMPAAA